MTQADQNGFNTTNIACADTRASISKIASDNEFSQDTDSIRLLERYKMACSNAVTHCIVNCDRGFPSERLQNYLSESGYGFECILPNHRQVFQRMTFCYYAMYLMLEKLKSLCVTGVMMTYL